MSKEITLPLEPALAELLKFRKELQNLSEDFVKAAAEAMNASKNFHAAFTNVKFDEVVRKNAEANEKMRESTEKLSKATEGYHKEQENVANILNTVQKINSKQLGSLEAQVKSNTEYKELLKNVSDQIKTTTKSIENQNKEILQQRAIIDRNKNLGWGTEIAEKKLDKLSESIAKSRKTLVELNQEQNELKFQVNDSNRIIRNQTKEMNAADGSVNHMRASLNQLLQVYDNLSLADREGDLGINIESQVQSLTAQISKAEEATRRFQRNVGNYSGSISSGFNDMTNAWTNLFSGNIIGAYESFSNSISDLNDGFKGLMASTAKQTIVVEANTKSNVVNTVITEANTIATKANTASDNLNTTSTGANTVAVEANTVANLTNTTAINETSIASSNAAKGGLSSFTNGIKNMTAWVLRFIATPTGMVIGGITVALLAGVVAIGAYIKSVWDYNKSIKETLTLTKQLSGEVGKSADLIRQKVQAISDTFNTDFNETIQAAKKLSENFNIPFNKALDEINLGLIKGGRYNKEYLDSINEYPVFFDKAGYSVSEFIDMINESFDQGVYNDKFIDGIKEADIALKEQTKSTRDALVNAYGASFTDDILQRIRIGATSTKDALNELAQKAKEVSLNDQQYAQLTADLYKSAGEDVGGAAKMFDIYRASVENANRPLTETELKLKNLEKANQDLGKAMDNALKSDTIVTLQQNFELFWIQTKIIFFELISFIKDGISWLDRMTGASDAMGVAWIYIQAVAKSFMEVIKTFKELAAVIGLNAENSDILKFAFKALLIPVKLLVDFLQRVTTTLRTLSLVTQEAIGFIVALKTTISDFDFSNITNFFSSLGDNIKKVRGLKEELALINSIDSANGALMQIAKDAQKAADKAIDIEKKRKEDQEKIDKEAAEKAAKEAEKAAKKKEELAKKYAAEEKKRKEEAERLAEKAYQEELALMNANLESYKLHNISKLESGKAFSKAVMDLEVERLEEILAQQEQIAIKESKLDYNKLQRKVANGQVLTSEEQKLLDKIYELNFNHSKALIEIQKSYDELGLKEKEDILKLDLLSKIANGEDKEKAERWYNDAVYDLRKENFKKLTGLNEDEVVSKFYTGQKLTAIESEYVDTVLKRRAYLNDIIKEEDKDRKEQKQKDQEEDFERYNNGLNYLSSVLGAEAEMRTALDSYKSLLNIKELNDDQKTSEAKLQLAANVAGAMAAIAGQESAFGQAMALTQAGINIALGITKAISSKGLAGVIEGIAIAAAGAIQIGKIAGAKQPKPPQFTTPKFAKGITNSGYEGPAIVDEIGAEIHLDKKGNIKSMGENKGPRLTQVKKGDTIIPSRFSEKIKAMMQTRLMPEAPTMNTLLLGFPIGNTPAKNEYDFTRLEKELKDIKKSLRSKKDKSYLMDNDKIIEVTTKANGTHQRYIDKIDSEPKNRPSRLN
ncbi:hypothetical protein [Empedobacter brevis]|uniref:hypothetical protein n=1 Tax=Empedobacter brevis TaxID=247 RepID=UPI0028AA9ABD|nr:hypothetical protein [Empedobacter brevis]